MRKAGVVWDNWQGGRHCYSEWQVNINDCEQRERGGHPMVMRVCVCARNIYNRGGRYSGGTEYSLSPVWECREQTGVECAYDRVCEWYSRRVCSQRAHNTQHTTQHTAHSSHRPSARAIHTQPMDSVSEPHAIPWMSQCVCVCVVGTIVVVIECTPAPYRRHTGSRPRTLLRSLARPRFNAMSIIGVCSKHWNSARECIDPSLAMRCWWKTTLTETIHSLIFPSSLTNLCGVILFGLWSLSPFVHNRIRLEFAEQSLRLLLSSLIRYP